MDNCLHFARWTFTQIIVFIFFKNNTYIPRILTKEKSNVLGVEEIQISFFLNLTADLMLFQSTRRSILGSKISLSVTRSKLS